PGWRRENQTPTSAPAEVGVGGKYRRFSLVEAPLRSDLYATADVIVVLQLQIVEISVPHLVGQAAIPRVSTEGPGTEVADFFAVRRIPPGVEFRIGGGFCDFVAGYVDRRIGRLIAAGIVLSASVTMVGVGVRLVAVNNRRRRAAVVAVVRAVRRVCATRSRAGAFSLGGEDQVHLAQAAGPSFQGQHPRDLSPELRVGDAVTGRIWVRTSARRIGIGIDIVASETTGVQKIVVDAANDRVILGAVVSDAVTRVIGHETLDEILIGRRQAGWMAVL